MEVSRLAQKAGLVFSNDSGLCAVVEECRRRLGAPTQEEMLAEFPLPKRNHNSWAATEKRMPSRHAEPCELPPFANALVKSGEALAYLHLSGSAVTQNQTDISYEATVKDRTVAFSYNVLRTCCGDNDYHGKAVVYQPAHDPNRIVVAFRAVRLETSKHSSGSRADTGKDISGNRADVEAMLELRVASADWLPSSEARISYGIIRHAGVIWACGRDGGLRAFLKTCKAREIHFTGLSLAGALAQVVALKSELETTLGICERARVITFGAVPWANASAAADYASVLGERAAHLCTHMTLRVSVHTAPDDRPWWVSNGAPAEDGRMPMPMHGDVLDLVQTYDVVDPLTCAFKPDHAMLCSTFAVESREAPKVRRWYHSPTVQSQDENELWVTGADVRGLARFPAGLVPRKDIVDLFRNQLGQEHSLLNDYLLLHRGRAYKSAVRGLVHSAMERARLRDEPAAITPVVTPVVAPVAAPTLPKLRRNSSSKRTLSDPENAIDTSNAQTTLEWPAQQTGGISKVASYGSLANSFKLDEINMF
jgi:hypothetical protein